MTIPTHIVIFRDSVAGTPRKWYAPRWLFRHLHCFVAIYAGGSRGWVVIDPYAPTMCIAHWPFQMFDGGDPRPTLRARGYAVVDAAEDTRLKGKRLYWLAPSCVRDVKRILSLRCWWAVTPDLLLKQLLKREKELG